MKNGLFFVLLGLLLCAVSACLYLAFIGISSDSCLALSSQPVVPAPQPLQPPAAVPVSPPAPKEPKWELVYQDNFGQPDCVQQYDLQEGKLEYHDRHKAMMLCSDFGKQAYAAVPKIFAGDFRVSFKALRKKQSQEVNIGVLFACRGPLKSADGYCAEWSHGQAQLKKNNAVQQSVAAPTPSTPDRWVSLELRRVGSKITMLMERREVLTWTDTAPLNAADHGGFGFCVNSDGTLVAALRIERNAN